jgi:hypothetical protein
MKLKLVFYIGIVISSAIPLLSFAQGFYLRTHDLRVKSYELASIQSITFNSNNLVLRKTGGSTETFPIPTISALYFNSLYTTAPEISSAGKDRISVYPNPAGSTLRISNLPQRENQVYIFGTDGRMLIRAIITPDKPEISLSGLTRGLYFLKVENQTVKFIRQ